MGRKQTRFKTRYEGIYYFVQPGSGGKPEKVYYARYRRGGREFEERLGGERRDSMTAAKASHSRSRRIDGYELPNVERRAAERADRSRPTLATLWTRYKESEHGVKSRAADASRFRLYLEGPLGGRQAHEITELDITRLKKSMASKSPQTVKLTLALLRRLVRHGGASLPFKLRLPKVENEKTEFLSPEQATKLLGVLRTSDDVQVSGSLLLTFFTGMRRSEIFRLRWDDVNFERNEIRLRERKDGSTVTIPMNENARALLLNHPRIGRTVFCNPDGSPLGDIRKRVKPLRDAAQLPDGFRPYHGLRHHYASTLVNEGVPVFIVANLLGHQNVATTERYSHPNRDRMAEATRVMDSVAK